MEQGIGVRFLESRDSLVGNQSLLAKALCAGFGEGALMQLSVCLDLHDRIGKRRSDLPPLVLGQHRKIHSTAPAVDRLRHVRLNL